MSFRWTITRRQRTKSPSSTSSPACAWVSHPRPHTHSPQPAALQHRLPLTLSPTPSIPSACTVRPLRTDITPPPHHCITHRRAPSVVDRPLPALLATHVHPPLSRERQIASQSILCIPSSPFGVRLHPLWQQERGRGESRALSSSSAGQPLTRPIVGRSMHCALHSPRSLAL